MKNAFTNFQFKGWAIMGLMIIMMSCGDDDAGGLEEIGFVDLPNAVLTDYEGVLQFVNTSGVNVSDVNGMASISKSGNAYNINFSNDVPSLTNRVFIKTDEEYISVDSDQSPDGIIIEDNSLTVQYTKDGNSWVFSGDR